MAEAHNDEHLLDAGYALLFEALLNEPFLDLMLFHAQDVETKPFS